MGYKSARPRHGDQLCITNGKVIQCCNMFSNGFVYKLHDFSGVKMAIWLTSVTTPNVLIRTF